MVEILKPHHFIEGSPRPDEEPSYRRLLVGEPVPLEKIEQDGPIYEMIVEGMAKRGEVKVEEGIVLPHRIDKP